MVVLFVYIVLLVIILRLMGRAWYAPHLNSGGIVDFYTWSHFLHGVIFSLIGLPWVIALGAEFVWEIIENTQYIIKKYRRKGHPTYAGDAIVNSISDLVICSLGWIFATNVPFYWSIIAIIVIETALYIFIRDNLLLNIIALIRK